MFSSVFFFNDTATTEIYTLSLHDALPISRERALPGGQPPGPPLERGHARGPLRARPRARGGHPAPRPPLRRRDRKSTRLNSSHANISYAVFCLKKKNNSLYVLNAFLRSLQ